MNIDAASFGILWPAFIAGLLVTATHVPLGMQVLTRGIVFIDLAVAQIAGVGVILADFLGWEPTGVAVQVAALSAAIAGAALLGHKGERCRSSRFSARGHSRPTSMHSGAVCASSAMSKGRTSRWRFARRRATIGGSRRSQPSSSRSNRM